MMSQIALLLRCERPNMPAYRRFSEAKSLHCQLVKSESLQIRSIDTR